jgi:hypothetical protein
LKGVECLWRNAVLGPVIRDAEAQEFALLWSRHRAGRYPLLREGMLGVVAPHNFE